MTNRFPPFPINRDECFQHTRSSPPTETTDCLPCKKPSIVACAKNSRFLSLACDLLRGVLATNTTLSSFPHHFPSDLKRIIRSIFCDYPLSRKIRRRTCFIFCNYPLSRKIKRITCFIFCDSSHLKKIRRLTRSPSAHFPHSKKLARIIRLIWFRPSPAGRENKTSPGRPRLVCSNARTKR